jgi:hypothetical protein
VFARALAALGDRAAIVVFPDVRAAPAVLRVRGGGMLSLASSPGVLQ